MNRSGEFEPTFNAELEKLKEFIEIRKASLEEEIEENLHQAIADAKDSLELIRENIEPKVDKIIQAKMEFIDSKMENWKKDFRYAAQEEVKAGSKSLTQELLENLDAVIEEKKNILKEELRPFIRKEIRTAIEPGLNQTKEDIKNIQARVLLAIGLAAIALAGVIILQLN